MNLNYWKEVQPPDMTTMALPKPDEAGPHYVTAKVKFPAVTECGGRTLSWWSRCKPWKQTLRCQRCQSSQAEHEWTTPHRSVSALFILMCSPTSPYFSFSLSPSVSWNITVGQKSPHWCLRGCIMKINELEVNMQAVCCLLLYTSQPIGFHQKLRWIVSPKSHNNAALFYLCKAKFKGHFKEFRMYISPH